MLAKPPPGGARRALRCPVCAAPQAEGAYGLVPCGVLADAGQRGAASPSSSRCHDSLAGDRSGVTPWTDHEDGYMIASRNMCWRIDFSAMLMVAFVMQVAAHQKRLSENLLQRRRHRVSAGAFAAWSSVLQATRDRLQAARQQADRLQQRCCIAVLHAWAHIAQHTKALEGGAVERDQQACSYAAGICCSAGRVRQRNETA